MLDKRKLLLSRVLAILLLLGVLLIEVFPDSAFAAENNAKKVLVTFGDPDQAIRAVMVSNLVFHFPFQADVASLEQVNKAELAHYSFIIYLFGNETDLPGKTIDLLQSLHKPILWIGAANYKKTISAMTFTYKGKTYHEKSLPVSIQDFSGDRQVYATASDGQTVYPLAAQAGQQWYFNANELFGIPGYILADFLHEFFGIAHQNIHEAFIRIEDVHPLVEPEQLVRIADYLYSKNIPFMVAVIPVYRHPETGEQISMNDRPEFVRALRYMESHGGSILLHGYTHQYRDKETGEGFEFWDVDHDAPIQNEDNYIRSKLEKGIAILAKNNLHPLGFEPPHYTMSQNGYRLLNKYFSTIVAQMQPSDDTYRVFQQIPYRLRKDAHNLHVIPETIGYVQNAPGDISFMMNENAKVMAVRDGVTGAFFHPYLSLEKLQDLIQSMASYPLQFIDLKYESHWVQSDFIRVSTAGNGEINVEVLLNSRLNELAYTPEKSGSALSRLSNLLGWGIAIVVGVFLLVFLVFIILQQTRRKVLLFEEEEAGRDHR